MTIAGFHAQNHPQQTMTRGARDSIDDRATPPELFEPLKDRFGFTLDVAATADNAKCREFYTADDDGLAQPWHGRIWCNPPYSDIAAWVEKAWTEWDIGNPELIVMLLPANRTEQTWWQQMVEPYRDGKGPARGFNGFRVEFLFGRPRFVAANDFVDMFGRPRGRDVRPPFGCCLLIWSP